MAVKKTVVLGRKQEWKAFLEITNIWTWTDVEVYLVIIRRDKSSSTLKF
jgi:hypothetical protein